MSADKAIPAPTALTLVSESGAEFESLEQLGPTVASVVKGKRTDLFLQQLDAFSAKKEAEVEKLCNEHYQDFVAAVERLTTIREGTRELRDRIVGLNDTLQTTGQDLVERKTDLASAKAVHRNMTQGIDTLNRCLHVLRLANRAKHQLETRALYAALQTLEELENVHLRKVSRYTFAQRLERKIPAMRESVQQAVIADLKEWFFHLRDDSRTAGTLAMRQARDRQTRWRRLSQQRLQQGFFSSVIELVMDEENEEDLLDNEQVKIDFKPLYQCIHIHATLGRAAEFRKVYEEDRQAQIDLVISVAVDLNVPESLQALGKMLQEVIGFFIVEHVVVHSTVDFRSKGRVDVLWTMVSDRVTRLVAEATRKCSNLKRLFEVRRMLMCFVSALEGYLYDCRKPRELMIVLAERYAALNMGGCGERFKKMVEEDEYRPMEVTSAEELVAVRSAYAFHDPGKGAADGGGGGEGPFPRTLPFSALVPLCCVDVKKSIGEYYQYVAGEDGSAAVAAADSVIQQAVDRFISRTVLPALLTKLRSTILSQVVQIVINMEYFESACGEFERYLSSQRISHREERSMEGGEGGGGVVLRAKSSFSEAKERSEKRVYELVNAKIDQFLEPSPYNYTPKKAATGPSAYVGDLVPFLRTVFTSILVELRPQIRKLVRFEAIDHLATSLTTLYFGPQVRQFNMNFVTLINEDVRELEAFLRELGDPNLMDTFVALRQSIDLLMANDVKEYLDSSTRNKKYSRLKPNNVAVMFEKLR